MLRAPFGLAAAMPALASHKYYQLQRLLLAARAFLTTGQVAPARRVMVCALVLRRLWWLRTKRTRHRYLARDVRDRGIWRNWRSAGLQHLSDSAMIRFCGFPLSVCYELATYPHLSQACAAQRGLSQPHLVSCRRILCAGEAVWGLPAGGPFAGVLF